MTVAVIMVHYTLDEGPVLSESMLLPYIMPGVRATAGMLPPLDQKLFKETERELRYLWIREGYVEE